MGPGSAGGTRRAGPHYAGFATEANLAACGGRGITGYVALGRPCNGEGGATGHQELTTMLLMGAAVRLKRPDVTTKGEWLSRVSDGSSRRGAPIKSWAGPRDLRSQQLAGSGLGRPPSLRSLTLCSGFRARPWRRSAPLP